MYLRIFTLVMITNFMYSCSSAQIKSNLFKATLETLVSGTVDTIGVNQLHDLLYASDHEDSSIFLLDARSKKEYLVSHLPGAVWVGYEDFNLDRVPKLNEEKTTVIIYCSVGYRSEKIGEKLQEKNIKNVKNLYGGIFEWSNRGYTLENSEEKKTEKVHGYSKKWSVYLDSADVVLE